MSRKGAIKHLANQEINYEKWDLCIQDAENRNVYALSWYLDVICPQWEALVFGNYEWVMPLSIGKKFGIKYLFQPFFAQQLGIFPAPPVSIQEQFAQAIYERFRFVQIQVNAKNTPAAFNSFAITSKENHVLPLMDSYPVLASQFSKHTKRNIVKTRKNNVQVVRGLNAHEFVNLKKQCVEVPVDPTSFVTLERVIARAQMQGTGIIMAAYSSANEVCSAAFFLRSRNRAVYLNAFSTEEGRKVSAMYAIVDAFIQEFADTGLMLDFEGSSVEGVARFYKGFGSATETYYHLYLNRLPFPLNLLKRNNA